MRRNQILIIIGLILFLSINFALKPYLKKKEAIEITKKVLDLWTEGNLMSSAEYWEKKQNYPPLYGILSYKITSYTFYTEQKISYAKISATLNFSTNNLYSNKKDWTFILKRKFGSWRVINFYPSNNPPENSCYKK